MLGKNLFLFLYVSVIPVIDVGRFISMAIKAGAWLAKWLLIRAFALSIFITVVPTVLYYGWTKIAAYVMQAVSAIAGVDGVWSGSVIAFTGLAGWIATSLKMPECASILLSCYATRFALSFIRR